MGVFAGGPSVTSVDLPGIAAAMRPALEMWMSARLKFYDPSVVSQGTYDPYTNTRTGAGPTLVWDTGINSAIIQPIRSPTRIEFGGQPNGILGIRFQVKASPSASIQLRGGLTIQVVDGGNAGIPDSWRFSLSEAIDSSLMWGSHLRRGTSVWRRLVAKITWEGGRDIKTLQNNVQKRVNTMREDAVEALAMTVEQGAVDTQDFLEAAVTKTGLARAEGGSMALNPFSEGGFPGRHDTGNMVGSVSHEVRNPRAKIVTGVFGWWGGNFEQYFRDQDQGEGNIPAARALPQALVRAEADFRRRMAEVLKGKTPS